MRYSKAPYNFIPLSKRVFERYSDINSLPAHNEILKDGYTGTIEYTINCESDLILSDGKGHFFKDTDGNYAIPGSSIRGMIRNNVMTLGFCSIIDDIEDSRFLYRRIAPKIKPLGDFGKNLRLEYGSRLGLRMIKKVAVLTKVYAGYIKYLGNESYEITKANEINGKTYFRIDDKNLHLNLKDIEEINYLKIGSKQNEDYKPYVVENISFELDEKNERVKSIRKDDTLKLKGNLINSGSSPTKRYHYIINEKGKEKENIPVESIRLYKEDLILTKKAGDKEKEEANNYYLLPKKGEEKPVFYTKYGGKIYFGFTPYLRIYYDKSIHDGIPSQHLKNDILDYRKAIFGFSDKEYGYKSRVSFEDAIIQNKPSKQEVEMILSEPKPTCIAHYLEQNKDTYSTYNSDFDIRGIKFYWLKEEKINNNNSENDGILSKEEIIKKGAKFKSKIEFNNLKKDELGLLLYSLCLNEDCYQQIGKGKPYGFGRIKIKDINLEIQNNNERYSSVFKNNKEKDNIEDYISYYKEYICKRLNLGNIEEDIGIKTLLKIKSNIIENNKLVDYLPLDEFKYYNPLPTTEEFFEKNINNKIEMLNKKTIKNQKKINDKSKKSNSNSLSKDSSLKDKQEKEEVTDEMLKKLQEKYKK